MISIIICSTSHTLCDITYNNIKDTIGVNYEIILIDNSQNKFSIFSAYNEGLKKSKYPILVFIHEDIMFRTGNWGELICKAFNSNKEIGMIGVIGSTMIFDISWGWWSAPQIGRIIQSNKTTERKNLFVTNHNNTPHLIDAVVCDGLFLAFPRIIFDKVSFDTKTYKGFHGYDMDISMQVLESGYKIKIIDNILIEHFSRGNINDSFIDACYKFYDKWKNKLPISTANTSHTSLMEYREDYLKKILHLCPKEPMLKSKLGNIFCIIYKIYQRFKYKS